MCPTGSLGCPFGLSVHDTPIDLVSISNEYILIPLTKIRNRVVHTKSCKRVETALWLNELSKRECGHDRDGCSGLPLPLWLL